MQENKASVMANSFCDQLKSFFGSKMGAAVISDVSNDVNYPSFNVSFKLYNYFHVMFGYERGSIGTSIVFSDNKYIGLNLTVGWWERILSFEDYFEEMDKAIRLRIPDKYLIAHGWMEDESSDTQFVKALVINYVKSNYSMNDKQALDAWNYLEQSYEVMNEFKTYVVTGKFTDDSKCVKVEGFSAQQLHETTDLTPLGAFNYLIYLKRKPTEALEMLKKGLPRK